MIQSDSSKVIVRDATPSDLHAICEIVREMGDGAADPIDEGYAAEALERPGFGILVAEEQGRVIAILSYSMRPNLWHGADACLIEILAVLASARGRGIGNELMTAVLDRAAARGCAEITVTLDPGNERALRLYRRHGLTEEIFCLERHL